MSRRRGTAAEFDDADAALNEVLAELEEAENYKAWLLELVSPHIHGRVLEVGAGRGTYSCEFRALGTALTAVEPSAQAIQKLRARVSQTAGVTVVEGMIDDVDHDGFDAAVMLNVLEHIDDDVEALRQINQRMAPGGVLCIWVPAFQGLYGPFDRRVGHHRRYRRRQLVERSRLAGFDLVESRYANIAGFFAWFLVVRVLRSSPTTGGMSKIYDRFIVPVVRMVERRVKPPFGQSLLVVVRKPTA